MRVNDRVQDNKMSCFDKCVLDIQHFLLKNAQRLTAISIPGFGFVKTLTYWFVENFVLEMYWRLCWCYIFCLQFLFEI